jgi:hypothetical protein
MGTEGFKLHAFVEWPVDALAAAHWRYAESCTWRFPGKVP